MSTHFTVCLSLIRRFTVDTKHKAQEVVPRDVAKLSNPFAVQTPRAIDSECNTLALLNSNWRGIRDWRVFVANKSVLNCLEADNTRAPDLLYAELIGDVIRALLNEVSRGKLRGANPSHMRHASPLPTHASISAASDQPPSSISMCSATNGTFRRRFGACLACPRCAFLPCPSQFRESSACATSSCRRRMRCQGAIAAPDQDRLRAHDGRHVRRARRSRAIPTRTRLRCRHLQATPRRHGPGTKIHKCLRNRC